MCLIHKSLNKYNRNYISSLIHISKDQQIISFSYCELAEGECASTKLSTYVIMYACMLNF